MRERCEEIVFQAIQALDVAASHAGEDVPQIVEARRRMIEHIQALERSVVEHREL